MEDDLRTNKAKHWSKIKSTVEAFPAFRRIPSPRAENHLLPVITDNHCSQKQNSPRDSYTNQARTRFPPIYTSGSTRDRLSGNSTHPDIYPLLLMHRKLRRKRSSMINQENITTTEVEEQKVMTEEHKIRLRRRLKGICKVLITFLHLWRYHMGKVNEILKTVKGLDALVSAPVEESDLLFNLSLYRADKQSLVSHDARRILQKPKQLRTDEDIHYVTVMMGNYESLAEYPLRMQKLMAEKAWYECYDAKRVLCREGHYPTCYYFILSGSAVMTTFDKTIKHSKTVGFLTKGDSFSEDVLMSHSVRSETTITKEFVELLVLKEEDFTEIFMSGGLKSAVDEIFAKNLSYLRDFPFDELISYPLKAMFTYYKRGTVLVNNSSQSDWIYIIKSGHCTVMKKLKKSERRQLSDIDSRSFSLAGLDENSVVESLDFKLRKMLEKHAAAETVKYLTYYVPDVNIPMNSLLSDVIKESKKKAIDSTDILLDFSRKSENHLRLPTIPELPERGSSKRSRIDSHDSASTSTSNSSQKSIGDIFVTVQTLSSGSCFGLIQTIADTVTHPTLSLVSNGSECFVIHKKLFMELAPHDLLHTLREQIFLYPTDEALQTNLDTALYWDHHKQDVLNQVLTTSKNQKILARSSG